jgi:type I restriction enzyme S subunit
MVAQIERHFSLIDAAERTIGRSLEQADRLRQSILKRAFEGRLVPQDPSDEPAEKLLERIKAERAELEAKRSTKKAGR